MLILGLTGSMGCGKSSVARLLAERGVRVLDSDLFARMALAPASPGFDQVVERFGARVLDGTGALDRAGLGVALQEDPHGWQALEAIVHPEVRRLQAEALRRLDLENSSAVVVLDEPLLFETGGEFLCDWVVVVACAERQMERLQQRGGMALTVQQAAMARQMTEGEKCRRADLVIDNRGSWEELVLQVESTCGWIGCVAGRVGESVWPKKWSNDSPPGNKSGSRGLAPRQVQDSVLVGFGAKP
ncbi:MAG: dephospho-CoA kinase [Magnetococcales bacterium]|nr:dephospho-CoA kinase [Magnetococcales bacterium]MBF0321447.1 dephospho-CoA kinase [Magnetococcales bacterium]